MKYGVSQVQRRYREHRSPRPRVCGCGDSSGESEIDEYFEKAGRFIIEKDKASIGMLQRLLKIGFNRAARIMDQLADAGVVGPGGRHETPEDPDVYGRI